MKRNTNTRKRRVASLKTGDGRKETELARDYFTQLWGDDFTRYEPIGLLTDNLAWTSVLPNFKEAQESAYRAWTTVFSETDFARSVAVAKSKSNEEFEQVFACARLRSGIVDRVKVIAGLEKTVTSKIPPPRVYQRVHSAVRDAERNDDPNKGYFAEFAAQTSASKLAHESNLVVSHKSSIAKRIFVEFWTAWGLWLIDPTNVLAWFETRNESLPESAKLPLPESPRTVEDWIKKLGLVSYKGKGRMIYKRDGRPAPDRILIEEIGLVRNEDSLPPPGSTHYAIGESFILNSIRK